MIFKERRFHQAEPSYEHLLPEAQSQDSGLEARIADFLASLADLDATQMSVVVSEGRAVLGGFAASAAEAARAADAIGAEFPGIPVENRLQVG